MCEIFDLDGAVHCLKDGATDMLTALPAGTCQQRTDDLMGKQHSWLLHAEAYDLSAKAFMRINKTDNIPWNASHSLCVLGGPIYVTSFAPGADLPIKFRPHYIDLLRIAKTAMIKLQNLNVQKNTGDIDNFRDYVIVHWRRGDQSLRCMTHQDTSVNCGAPEDLIKQIKQIIADGKYEHKRNFSEPSLMFHREGDPKRIDPKHPPTIVYIATNELNKTVLDIFSAAGFLTFRDLRFPMHLNSLDQFVVELQMMIDADFYLAWGVSSIHDFVRAAFPRGRDLERRVHPERFQENFIVPIPFGQPHCAKDLVSDLLMSRSCIGGKC